MELNWNCHLSRFLNKWTKEKRLSIFIYGLRIVVRIHFLRIAIVSLSLVNLLWKDWLHNILLYLDLKQQKNVSSGASKYRKNTSTLVQNLSNLELFSFFFWLEYFIVINALLKEHLAILYSSYADEYTFYADVRVLFRLSTITNKGNLGNLIKSTKQKIGKEKQNVYRRSMNHICNL